MSKQHARFVEIDRRTFWSIRALIDYVYDAEQRDFESLPASARKSHIFAHIRRARNWSEAHRPVFWDTPNPSAHVAEALDVSASLDLLYSTPVSPMLNDPIDS